MSIGESNEDHGIFAGQDLIHLADSVRHALIDFAHTNNKDTLLTNELRDLYTEADEIIAKYCYRDE